MKPRLRQVSHRLVPDVLGVAETASDCVRNLLLGTAIGSHGRIARCALEESPVLQAIPDVEETEAGGLTRRQAEERLQAWKARHRQRVRPKPPTGSTGENLTSWPPSSTSPA